jgi:hypothetical protein
VRGPLHGINTGMWNKHDLTDQQWKIFDPAVPEPARRRDGRGRPKIGKTKRGKGSKIMAVADRHGLPVAICVESATPHEVKLATNTLVQMVIPDAPQNRVGDNAYDSDKLDSELRRYRIELIAPYARRLGASNEQVFYHLGNCCRVPSWHTAGLHSHGERHAAASTRSDDSTTKREGSP